jgi:hypothetical protein
MVETGSVDGLLTYRRRCEGQTFERILVSKTGEIVINPVEPGSLPKDITDLLMMEFPPMMIEPGATQTVYLKFPVEIGVFIESARDIEVLDIFGLGNQKYTLYGPPADGVIALYCRSAIYPDIPPVEFYREGVMELSIQNLSLEWMEVSCAVFNSVSATMRVLSRTLAETDFVDAPLRPGMEKAVELNKARKIPVLNRGHLMEWGH